MGSDAYNNILRDWINEHTGNLLTEQAGKLELNADTVLALVSTLYYSASWHDKFSSAATTQDVFHAPNGDVSTDFLHSSDSNTVYYGRWLLGHRAFAGEQRPDVAAEAG